MQVFFWILPPKVKQNIKQKAQEEHDCSLAEYQKKFRDYGYYGFYLRNEKIIKPWWLNFATFENIDRSKIPILYDNRFSKWDKKICRV